MRAIVSGRMDVIVEKLRNIKKRLTLTSSPFEGTYEKKSVNF